MLTRPVNDLTKLREQATAAADEKKAAHPNYSKLKCTICGKMVNMATTCNQKNKSSEKQRIPLADHQCYYCSEK